MINRLDLTVGHDQGAVIEIVFHPDSADNGHQPFRLGQEVQEGLSGGINKIRFQEQVLGRVPGDGHFRKGHQVHFLPSGQFQVLFDLPAISRKVPHGSVDLGQGDAQVHKSSAPCQFGLV